jgi:diaminohydroxyphosphoribosylaminopyrimidine deaminase/5-amino-6-(5-phosphoribosylamino)uracil reductase
MASATELDAMRRAIALSGFGLGTTSPNPPVGCVVLDATGRVIGEGYHHRKGEAHAEVHALRAAGDQARGGTAAVTLEPCNHYGRTPPCRQALIEAGVARVVIAVIDPTSREEGGAARLRSAGVDVEVGVLTEEATLVLGPWLHALTNQRPHVRWAYVDLNGETDDLPPEIALLNRSVDVVVWPDGRLEEGVAGAHRSDVFSLPSTVDNAKPDVFLTDLYDRGVRSLLFAGRSGVAELFAAEGLVDQVNVYLPRQPTSFRPATLATARPFVPAGFVLTSVDVLDDHERLDFRAVAGE